MLNKNTISDKIKAVIANNVDKNENIDLKKTFQELGVGSLTFVKILVEIEIQFSIEIDDCYYTTEYHDIDEFVNKITICLLGEKHYEN